MKRHTSLHAWTEPNRVRTIMTPDGGLLVEEGQWAMVLVGDTPEDVWKRFEKFMRTRGECDGK